MIKRVTALAAMVIFAGTMIVNAGPAQATRISYHHDWAADVRTYPGGPYDGTVYVTAYFQTSLSEGSVALYDTTVWSQANHSLVIDTDRWQTANGKTVYRGPGGTINPGEYFHLWRPNLFLLLSQDPLFILRFHEPSPGRTAFKGSAEIKALPVGNYTDLDTVGLGLKTSVSVQASTVPEPSSIWIILTGLVGLIGYHWRSRLFPGRHSA